MILDSEDGQFFVAQALHRVIVKVNMTYFQTVLDGVGVDGKTVVLSGDIDPVIREVFHRVVASPVAELHLEGLSPEGPAD